MTSIRPIESQGILTQLSQLELDLTETIKGIRERETVPPPRSRTLEELVLRTRYAAQYRIYSSDTFQYILEIASYNRNMISEAGITELEKMYPKTAAHLLKGISAAYAMMPKYVSTLNKRIFEKWDSESSSAATATTTAATAAAAPSASSPSLHKRETEELLSRITMNWERISYEWAIWRAEPQAVTHERYAEGLFKLLNFRDLATEDMRAVLRTLYKAQTFFDQITDAKIAQGQPLPLKERKVLASILKEARFALTSEALEMMELSLNIARAVKTAFPTPSPETIPSVTI